MTEGLSWRIVSGTVDIDVTDYVRGTPNLTYNALGGFELARVLVDLPLSTFPDLGEQSRLVVTDPASHVVWEGYCTDPGGVDNDDGEAFDLVAAGAMVLASDRVEPLVYRDELLSSWSRASGSVESGTASQYDDDTIGTGWLIAHPQGYPITTGAAAGIEYRLLQHSSQTIGSVEFTAAAGAVDTGFGLQITTYSDGVLVDTLNYPLSTTPTPRTLVAGDDFASGVDTVAISIIRTGAATNVTTGLSYVRLTSLAVNGDRLDQFGNSSDPSTAVTSSAVIADLIGRGMLAQVDPDLAVVEESAALHTQLAFPNGVRGAGVITELRKADPDMVWMYGPRGTGGTVDAPAGHEFTWARWPETEIRYDLTEDDAVRRPGGEDQRAHRISVFYRETETGPLKRVVVELADPGGQRLREADPINLPNVATELDAQAAGEDALARLSLTAQTATATVGRLILDRTSGFEVEPWEIRPGGLARIVATGELLRITEVSCSVGEAGATATLTLGDPTKTLDDRLLSFLRGETDPTAPLITLPPSSSAPPVTGKPTNTDGLAPTESPTLTWRPGIGSVFLSWDPVANDDSTSYRILIGTSPSLTESPSTVAGVATGGFFIARRLPNGTAFQNDTTYYARAIAFDADGDAPAGAVASGTVIAKITETEISDGAVNTPQLNANAITTDLLLANDAWIGALRATDFYGETITGPIIRSAADGQRMEVRADLSAGEIRGYSGLSLETAPARIDPSGSSSVVGFSQTARMVLEAGDLGYGQPRIVLRSTRDDAIPIVPKSRLYVGVEGDSNLCPIGAIVMWTRSSTAPYGWMLCDGSAVPSDYALYNYMTNTPNLVGKFPFGAGGSVSRNASGGGSSPTLTDTSSSTSVSGTTGGGGSHNHLASTDSYTHNQEGNTTTGGGNNRLTGPATHSHSVIVGSDGTEHTHSFNAGSHTHDVSVDVPYFGVVFIIRAYW